MAEVTTSEVLIKLTRREAENLAGVLYMLGTLVDTYRLDSLKDGLLSHSVTPPVGVYGQRLVHEYQCDEGHTYPVVPVTKATGSKPS